MPYIKQSKRVELENSEVLPLSEGDLNYIISKEIDKYLSNKGLCYAHINEVIGVLECAKLELYRRIAAPYEDQKINENGDVYNRDFIFK